jgi:nitrite reductase (NO-forming)
MQKAIDEDADYVVFNGNTDALTGDNAITAEVGETIRLFVGNGGPNLTSSFHVIGEIFDRVHVEAGNLINHNVQTTLIPPGGAAIVEFKVEAPGTFVLVDHAIFRAFNKGALGMLKVSGEDSPSVYSGTIQEGIYLPEGGSVQTMPGNQGAPEAPSAESVSERIELGKNIYTRTCLACHQEEGQGIPNAFPPLAKADYLNADVERAINIVLHGLTGEITVNGKNYNSVMTAQTLTDEQVANVLTYVYNSWGNSGAEVTPAMVTKAKSSH